MKRFLLFAPFVAVPLLVFSCGGSTATTADASDAADTDDPAYPSDGPISKNDAGDAATDGGSVVVPNDATLIVKSEGGFAANGTDTSTCTVEDETYTFEVKSAKLTWKVCVIEDGGAKNSYVDGNRTLSGGEAKSFTDAVQALTLVPSSVTQCGADKPTETLEIDSPSAFAPELFYDQFYHCQANDGKTYVDGMDDLLQTARGLAH